MDANSLMKEYRSLRNRALNKLARIGVNALIEFTLKKYIPAYAKLVAEIPEIKQALNKLLGMLEEDLHIIDLNDPNCDWNYWLAQRVDAIDKALEILKLRLQINYARFLLAQKGLENFPCDEDAAELKSLENQRTQDAVFILTYPFGILRLSQHFDHSDHPGFGGGGAGGRW